MLKEDWDHIHDRMTRIIYGLRCDLFDEFGITNRGFDSRFHDSLVENDRTFRRMQDLTAIQNEDHPSLSLNQRRGRGFQLRNSA